MLPEASARLLREYVRGGGTLVTEARLGWSNERGHASERIPGIGLWDVMGCRETAVQTAPNGRTELRWSSAEIPGVAVGDRLPARWYEETLEPLGPQSRVLAQFDNGSPAAVVSGYGAGRTLMLGSYVSAAYQTTPRPEVARFYAGLLTWAGVRSRVTVSSSDVEVRHLETADGVLLFVFNHGGAHAASAISLRVPGGAERATDLESGTRVALARDTDTVRIDVALDPGGVQVLWIEQTARK